MMDLQTLLDSHKEEILAEANEALSRSHLKHYEQAGSAATSEKLRSLFELTSDCVRKRNLSAIVSHAENVARQRFNGGYDLQEVQTAFNVLEETIWKRIIQKLEPGQFAEALGLIATVLGAGKDTLARTYVSMASKSKSPSLDLTELFEGTGEA
jgi:hypothetical protein